MAASAWLNKLLGGAARLKTRALRLEGSGGRDEERPNCLGLKSIGLGQPHSLLP
jgi:hypothetical protein